MTAKTKKFAAGTILTISFFHYIALIAQAAHDYKYGLEMWLSDLQGFDAAWGSLVIYGIFLTAIGVLPAAWAIQLTFLVRRKAIKKGLPDKKVRTVTAVHIVGAVIVGALIAICTAGTIF